MAINIGINGFGRIGRYLLCLLQDNPNLNLSVINARADNSTLAHLLKYDSVYGRYGKEVSYDDGGLIVSGRHIPVTRRPNNEWDWAARGVDIVVETTGKIVQRDDLAGCFDALTADCLAGKAYFKVYRQFKMYNDPRFNPALVAERSTRA